MFLYSELVLNSLIILDCREYKLFAKWMIEVARQLIYSQISCYSVFLQRWFYIAWNSHTHMQHTDFTKINYFSLCLPHQKNDGLNCKFARILVMFFLIAFAKDRIFQMAFSMAFHLLIASVYIFIICKVQCFL